MTRNTSVLLALSVVAGPLVLGCEHEVVTLAARGSADAGSCPQPTLEQCQNPTWLDTDPCGMAERDAMKTDAQSPCSRLLVAEALRLSQGIENQVLVTPDGGTADGKLVPNPDKGVKEIDAPTAQLCLGQLAAIHATADGLSAEDQALRAQWEANGNRVVSCQEYVYEKYYDYARFEDAIATHFGDFSYIADVAFGPSTEPTAIGSRAASGQTLKMKDGTDMPVYTPEAQYLVDFDVPNVSGCTGGWSAALIDDVFGVIPQSIAPADAYMKYLMYKNCSQYAPFNTKYTDRTGYVPRTPMEKWQWHQTSRAAVLAKELPLVQADAMYANVREFQDLMAKYKKYATAGTPACCTTDPAGVCCTGNQALGTALTTRLRELFDLAFAAGCAHDQTSICTWSPRYFVDQVRSSFCSATSADYQRCLDATGDDFTNLRNYTFYNSNGSVWTSASSNHDYTTSPTAVDEFIRLHGEWLADYVAALPSWVRSSSGALHAPLQQAGNNFRAGNQNFGAFFNYDAHWGTTGYGANQPASGNLCEVGLEAKASASAGGWVFGSGDITALDASVGLSTAHGAEWHFDILDLAIWTWGQPPDVTWTIAGDIPIVEDETLVEKEKVFSVYGIPVMVRGGLTGSLGMKYEFGATQNPPGVCGPSEKNIHVTVAPYAQLDAFGEAGVGMKAVSAGLGCELLVLRLDFPFTVGAYLKPPNAAGTPATDWSLEVSSNLDLVYHTLDGRFYLFLDIGLVLEYDLFNWNGLEGKTTLFKTDLGPPADLLVLQSLMRG